MRLLRSSVHLAALLAATGVLGACVSVDGLAAFTPRRPSPATWKRTLCGGPSGVSPAVPAGSYMEDKDFPGHDMAPCGSDGCTLNASASHFMCEAKCNATSGCVAYVYAPSDCSGKSGPICWLKEAASGSGSAAQCRNSRIIGHAATSGADIPSRWGAQVTADPAPLPEFPRPQMVHTSHQRGKEGVQDLRTLRDAGGDNWLNLNGLWEWEPATGGAPPFGKTLKSSILVPFPVESCLSGVAPSTSKDVVMRMWYRLELKLSDAPGTILLHFGAVDWQTSVYVNGRLLANHTGGYDGFSIDISGAIRQGSNELLVYVFDPSDTGAQPNGKQRISAIDSPGGDTYTPSSGIWQTVWLEQVPTSYISDLHIDQASMDTVTVTVAAEGVDPGTAVQFNIMDGGKIIQKAAGAVGQATAIRLENPALWSPGSPHLYDMQIVLGDGADSVVTYFGLRTFGSKMASKGRRIVLNGNYTFLAGFLDQSWWPDGLYTAPSDAALAYDIQAVPMFGLNMIRLHQKVNSERWYYHADQLGVIVLQDMIQKYKGATAATIPLFVQDLRAMIFGRRNHPCIVQFETFNEGDCWEVFKDKPYDVAGIVALARQLDPTRLVDTDSGGKANNMNIGDVNDIHSYPYPGDPQPSSSQYAMVGEFGGIGAFVSGKEWVPGRCHTYLHVDLPSDEASTYMKMAATLQSRVDHLSASVYTQTTDVELECDGFLNFDRSNKFSDADTAAIRKANQAIIAAAAALAD